MTDEADTVRRLLEPHAESLPCGRSLDDVLEQATQGRADRLDDHQRNCPHCRAALIELSTLWQPVRALAAEPVQAPAALASRVTHRVEQLVHDVWYTMQITDLGTMRVAARIVARIARDAAQHVPGVQAVLGRSSFGRIVRSVERASFLHRHPNAAVGVLGRTAAVDLAVAVRYGQPVHVVAREVQDRVRQQLRDAIGLQAITVNVTIDDVLY